MIRSLVKTPVVIAQHLLLGAAKTGLGVATTVLGRVLPGDGGQQRQSSPARPSAATEPSAPASAPVDITPPEPTVSAEPVTQPKAPEKGPTPGATTTLADPAPATATPATSATARKATARKAAAKPSKATQKAAPGATKAQKAVAKKTPAKPSRPTKPASTLDEPLAPVEQDAVVYSSGPDTDA